MIAMPASLRGRYAMLLVLVVVVGHLLTALWLQQLVLKPRLAQAAQSTADTAEAMRAGLLALPAEQRDAFVGAFNERHSRGEAAPPAPVRPDDAGLRLTRREHRFVQEVSSHLENRGPVSWSRQHDDRLELRLGVEGANQWLVFPGLRVVREFSGAWLIATLTSAALGLALALWLLGRVGKPLAQVERAAQCVARGETPPPLPEDGPREIATVSRSFNAMVSELARADRERALMLAGVSHDLRTPLTKLRIGVEIAQDRLDEDLLLSMRRSIEEMDAILTQFLDFARANGPTAKGPVDLWALAQQVARAQADYGRVLALRGGPVPQVAGHEASIRRAIDNLVENAFRHGRMPVSISVDSDASRAWLDVCDAGEGIAPEQSEELKQPFRRGSASRSGGAGAGLGLAIVDRLLRQNDGDFLLERNGAGTRARIRLPVRK